MTATRRPSRRPQHLWMVAGLGALMIIIVVAAIALTGRDDQPAPLLVWTHDIDLANFPPSGPMAPVRDSLELALDEETGCFIEIREPSAAVVVWPPGTTRGTDEATVISPDGRAITAPSFEAPFVVARVPARSLDDQIEHLDRCTTEGSTYVALVMGLDR